MRFYMLSDLHIGNGSEVEKAKDRLKRLCREIRTCTDTNEMVLFIVLGDVINTGDFDLSQNAKSCFNLIQEELKQYSVKIEFVPGNHDLEKQHKNLQEFDNLIAEYGSSYKYESKSVHSCVYDGVNFIFADSTLSRDEQALGMLDVDLINAEIKPGYTNILFCHHALFQDGGGSHDTIENAEEVYKKLNAMKIRFLFHGHVHQAAITIPDSGLVEVGCGSLSADTTWRDSLRNQFSVGYIQNNDVVYVERWVDTDDGSAMYAYQRLYPKALTFKDPNTVLKRVYDPVTEYNPRYVSSYDIVINNPYYFCNQRTRETLYNAMQRDKKILLLADAGMGKSYEVQNLAYELHNKKHTVKYNLRNYSGQEIQDLIPCEYRDIHSHCCAILFDGYDELSDSTRDIFERKLRDYSEDNVDVYILITSRSNFCYVNENCKCNKFPDFSVYVLDKLSDDSIKCFLQEKGVNISDFYEKAYSKKIEGLLTNPFYLRKLINLFLKCNELPEKSRLMESLIKCSFDIDDKKVSGDLEDIYDRMFSQLEYLACIMQLMQKQTLNNHYEFQKIIYGDGFEIVKKSGLIKRVGNDWAFLHNNFREYLAARYLSKLPMEKSVSFFSDGKDVKPSWVNTVGYLTGMDLKWDLSEWLMKYSPTALVKFEPDRVNYRKREEVFKQIFLKYEKLSLHFNDELCDVVELANFGNNPCVLNFILDRISSPRNYTSQYTAVNILMHFPNLYGYEDEVKDCLMTCCEKYPQTDKQICRLCLIALCKHKLSSPELTEKLMNLFDGVEDDFIRLGMYEYLILVGEHEKYVDYFLSGLPYMWHSINSHDSRIGNEGFELVRGLCSMSTYESVVRLLEYFTEEDRLEFYDSDAVVKKTIDTASNLYFNESTEIYNSVVECYVKAANNMNSLMTRTALEFFSNTGTMTNALVEITNQFEGRVNFISDLIYYDSNNISILKDAYLKGILKESIFCELVVYYVRESSTYEIYSKIIKDKSGIDIPEYKHSIDYHEFRNKVLQEYYNNLMDEIKRNDMMLELLQVLGDDVDAGDLLEYNTKVDRNSPLWHLKSAIYRVSPPYMKVSQFLSKMNIDEYIVFFTGDLLRHGSKILISNCQREYLTRIVDKLINSDIFRDAIIYKMSGFSVKYPILQLMYVVRFLDYRLDENTLLMMTEFPKFLFGDENNDNKKFIFLESKLERRILRERLIENVKAERVKGDVLKDHIEYFLSVGDGGLTKFALDICKNTKSNSQLRSIALEYLYTIYGDEYVLSEIIPYANGEFLIEIKNMCKYISSSLLCQAMEACYAGSKDLKLLTHLISLGSIIGINDYVEMVYRMKRPPENIDNYFEGPTTAIGNINDPKGLHYLEKLLVIVMDEEFVDLKWRGLKSNLTAAFANCGKTCPQMAIEIIKKYRPDQNNNENNYRLCNHMIREIERAHKMISDNPKTLEEAKIFCSMHVDVF